MTKTILLDADGVFVDFVKGFLAVVKQVTGKDFTADQITEFDIPKSLGLTREESSAVYSRIQPGFCRNLDPIPGAVEAVQRLALDNEIFIVTSPLKALKTWASEREEWIAEHLKFSTKQIISTSAKRKVRGDIFVDDRAENCFSWNEENFGPAVIWESPWNRSVATEGCFRFNDWEKLERLVKEIE